MHQLDSLRTFAFAAVALSHWLPRDYQHGLPFGTGVQLFFVLSGFLITGILLDYRAISEANPFVSPARVFRVFYLRRSLRIFPLFYATIAAAIVLNIDHIRQLWPWHAAYFSNIYYVHGGEPDSFRHFWSLAVEEQFYLVWPTVMLFIPRRALAPVILSLIGIAPLFRAVSETLGSHLNYLPLSCFDSLGAGAWLAGAKRGEFHLHGFAQQRRNYYIAAAVFVAITAVLFAVGGIRPWITSLGHTALVVGFAALVWRAAEGIGGPIGSLLGWRPLVFLGQISYGLYVFHHFFNEVDFAPAFAALGWPNFAAGHLAIRLLLQFACTAILGLISWHLLEKPINDLKRFVRIQEKPATILDPTVAGAPIPAVRE